MTPAARPRPRNRGQNMQAKQRVVIDLDFDAHHALKDMKKIMKQVKTVQKEFRVRLNFMKFSSLLIFSYT